jgi:hypothetical protein
MGELIAEMRSLDDALAADERTHEIRAALNGGVEQLQAATSWLLEQGPLDPNNAGSASVNLLMLAGVVVGGWQMARAALAIVNGAASDDPSFAEAKVQTVRFYALHIMPKARGLADAAMAGADAVMGLPEESF